MSTLEDGSSLSVRVAMLEHGPCTYVAMVKDLPVNRIINTLRCFGLLEGTMQNKIGYG